jgi:serine/threonine protein kinase
MECSLSNRVPLSEREIFLAAFELETSESRGEYLATACGENIALRERVELLLHTHDSPSPFMQMPVTEVMHLILIDELDVPQDAVVGSTIDNYRLLEEIGTGGMGSVFKAQQQWPVERHVALKIIRPGMDTGDIVARFEAERQTLAVMSHPNIARVLDGGATASGRPYFVMELVDGCPITEYCSAQQLSIREKLKVLISVCEAVQHAHHRGIIHRDLKPGNILVESVDGKPFVKVIDFGIQKAIGTHTLPGSMSALTGGGSGTPIYMSPEQAGHSQEAQDTRTDVYTLGVLLYELLTGETPFARQAAKKDSKTLRRLICKTDAPLPSQHMAGVAGVAKSNSINHIATIGDLSSTAQNELDWITANALNRLPDQRYDSPGALAEDLQRFLNGDVVLAAPHSTRYRTYKTLLKHRWSVLLFAGVSISLLLGMLVSIQQALIARSAERLAARYLEESTAEQARYRKLAWASIIQRAYMAADEGRLCDASSLLNKLDVSDPEARARPEWNLLHREVTHSFRKLLTDKQPLHEVRVVAGVNRIVAVGEDGRIYVADADSGALARTIETEIRSLHALAISPDGILAAVGGVTDLSPDLARVRVFNLTSGDAVAELPAQITTVESLEFSANSLLLACGSRYEPVQIFEIAAGQPAATLPAARRNLWLSRSPNGKQLAALEATKAVWLCDFQPPSAGRSLATPWPVIQAIWEPVSGRLVCFLKGDHAIVAFDPVSQTYLAEFQGTANAACLALSGDGGVLFAALESGELISWPMPSLTAKSEMSHQLQAGSEQTSQTTTTGQPVILPSGRWKLSNAPLTSIAVSDTAVFAASFSGEVIRFQLPDRQALPGSETLQVSAIAWSSDGSTLVAGCLDGSVNELVSTPVLLRKLSEQPSHGSLATGADAWKIVSPAQQRSVAALAVTDDRKMFAWARRGDEAIVIRESGIEDRLLPHAVEALVDDDDAAVKAMAFSSASDSLAWTADRHLRWAGLSDKTNKPRDVLLPGQGRCLAWSPDGTALFVGGNFSELIRVDPKLSTSRTLQSTGTGTTAIRVSSNGRRLVSGHSDGALRFRDLADERTATAHIHQSAVTSICLSQDGRLGVSCDSKSNLALWFANSGDLIGLLRAAGTADDNDAESYSRLTFANNDRHLRAAFVTGAGVPQIRSWNLSAELRPPK